MLANWLYFLALGLVIPVLGRVISTVVNTDGSPNVSPASSIVGGDVEALDKLCTFLFVGFLGALSDVLGRKPLMAYSALGFSLTCYIQARAKGVSMLFLADLIDGLSSCMSSVCNAYVADASPPDRRAVNLGIFQGVSVAGAFILGFPISALLDAKYGLRAPMYVASAVGLLNFVLIVLLVPESLPAEQRKGKKLDLRSANPLGALNMLLGRPGILRGSAAAYFLVWLGNACINSQFGNYVNHLFGWGPQESAPLLVLVGVMIAIAPPALVPRLGLKRSIEYGAAVYALGLLCTAFAHSPLKIIASTLLTSVGCICIPALVAFIANQAAPAERGALLGALETLQELCLAIAHSSYGRLFAFSISDAAPMRLPGAVFLAASAYMLGALAVIRRAFAMFPMAAASFF